MTFFHFFINTSGVHYFFWCNFYFFPSGCLMLETRKPEADPAHAQLFLEGLGSGPPGLAFAKPVVTQWAKNGGRSPRLKSRF